MNSLLQTFKEKPIWFLLGIELLFFFRPVFFSEVFYFRDLHSHFLPKRELVAEYLSELQLPLWDPYLQGGKPLLGNPNNMALYPSNLLYLVFSSHRALTIEILLHHLMAMLALYVFCRMLAFRQSSSFLAAVIYGFSGYFLSTTNLLNWLIALAYLPVLFCFWHQYLLHRKWKWWIASVCAASLQLLAGAPEFTILSFICLLAWSCFYGYSVSVRSILLKWGALALFTIALCAIQILPALELSRFTVRATGFGFDSTTAWSLHPYRILEFVFPGILGRYDSLSPTSFWGQKLEGELPFILSVYFGLTALVLACIGALSNRNQTSFPFRLRIFLFCVCILCILAALGRYLPGLSWIFDYFSFRSPFRFPVKLLAAAIFPLSLLAAIGLEILFSDQNKVAKGTLYMFWGIEVCLLLIVVSEILWAEEISKILFDQTANPEMKRALRNAVLHSFYIWTLICICVSYATKYPWMHRAVVVVVLLDLFVSGVSINMSAPAELLTTTPTLATLVREKINNGKLYRTYRVDLSRFRSPSEDTYWRYLARQQMLVSYLPSKFKIPVIFHDDLDGSSLIELNYMRLVMDSLPWNRKLKILSASGVNLILTDEVLNEKSIFVITKVVNPYGAPLYLYANKNALGSITFVSRPVIAKSFSEALQLMTKPNYNPREAVILANDLASSANGCSMSRIHQQRLGKQERDFVLETECDGYLVFTDVRYPGWRVSLDGKDVPMKNANAIYSAIPVSKGTHHIKKSYFPKSFLHGAVCSFVALMVLGVLALKKIPR